MYQGADYLRADIFRQEYAQTVRRGTPQILDISLVIDAADLDVETKNMELTKQYAQSPRVKSRNMTVTTLDLAVELKTDNGDKLVRVLIEIEWVAPLL